jgi:hypothetical protein
LKIRIRQLVEEWQDNDYKEYSDRKGYEAKKK